MKRGIAQTCFWFTVLLFLCFVYCSVAHPQQIPVVNHNGTPMYAPDKPFESINLQSCTGPGCSSGGANLPFPCLIFGTSSSAGRCGLSSDISNLLGYIPAQSPNLSGSLSANLLARYNFAQGSGATLVDISGNGNNGTFAGIAGTTSPTWLANGLEFALNSNDSVELPSALIGAKTLAIAYYTFPVNTVAGGSSVNFVTNSPVISNTLQNAGLTILDTATCCGVNYGSGGIFNQTATSLLLSGFHVRIYTLGAGGGDLDHIYIDGIEAPYASQGASVGLQTSGNLAFGSANAGAFINQDTLMILYDSFIYSDKKTAADATALTQLIDSEMITRGIPTQPSPQPTGGPTLFCVGDSIQALGACQNNLTLTNQPAYTVQNWGIGGVKLAALTASEENRIAPQCKNYGGGPNVALVEGAQNDINGSNQAASYQNMLSEIQMLHRAGCKVFVMPLLSSGNDPYKNTFNALERKTVIANGADGIADDAADPNLGADNACSNGTYFQAGCLHPTVGAGTAAMGAAISNELNYYFGSSPFSPTVVSATTYTLVAGDGYVDWTQSSNSTATLPNCIGQTGAVYRINFATSGTNTLSVKNAVAAEPINGVDHSSSALVVLTGPGTVSFRDVANDQSTAGCHWDFSSF